ncbi:MAG: flagellar hook-associated protein FlgL, partial [Proteobacteria bacterium]|nr:flagellar hook-associated protein FlgL [Pseudomonadota bacterium]
ATESAETRKIFAIELREQLESLMQTANQRDGNGRFLFAGNQDGSQPVSRNASGFLYNGDQGERVIRIGATRLVSDGDSGAAVFFDIRNGNGTFRTSADATNTGTGVLGTGNLVDPSLYDKGQYTVRFIDPDNYEVLDSAAVVIATGTYQSGESIAFRGISFSIEGAPAAGDEFLVEPSRYQSMFQTLQNIVDVLESSSNNTVDTVTLRNRLNAGLQEIDQSLLNVSAVRTKIGIRLNAIDSQLDNNSAASILAQQAVSELEDLDYAEALSTLSLQAVVLEAAQQSFVLTQRLSLFRFL